MATAETSTPATSSRLLALPVELRESIFTYSFCHSIPSHHHFQLQKNNYLPMLVIGEKDLNHGCYLPALTQVSRQIRQESLPIFLAAHRVEIALWRERFWSRAEAWFAGISRLPSPVLESETTAVRGIRDWSIVVDPKPSPPVTLTVRLFAPWEVYDEDRAREKRDDAATEFRWSQHSRPAGSQRVHVVEGGQRFVLIYEMARPGPTWPVADQLVAFLRERIEVCDEKSGSEDQGAQGLRPKDVLDLIDMYVERGKSSDEALEDGPLSLFD